MSYEDPKIALPRAFLTALKDRDWTGLRALVTDDAVWILPGENTISGPAIGGDAIIERARKIVGYGLNFIDQGVF